MSNLILPSRFTSQPQGAVSIDWSNPITKGLKIAILPSLGWNSTDVVGKKSISAMYGGSTLAPRVIDSDGMCLLQNRVSYNQVTTISSWTDVTGEGSAFLIRKGAGTRLWEIGSTGNVDDFPFSAKAYSDAFWTSRWISAVDPPSGKVFSNLVKIGVSVKNGSQRAFWDGPLWTSATNTGGFAVPAQMAFGADLSGSGTQTNGESRIYLALVWSRFLSDLEHKILSINPWQVFKAPPRLYFAPSGGGGSTAYTLTCASGTYTTSGKTATLTYTRTLVCSSGVYTTSGKVATLQVAHKLICASGTYTTSGKAAVLTYTPGNVTQNYTLTCSSGTYTVSGKTATLNVAHALICASGAYTTSGKAAILKVAHSLQCASGTYVVSGKAAILTYTSYGPVTYTLTCSSGSYVVSGKAVTLTYVGHAINVSEPEYTVYLQKRQFKTTLQKRSFRVYS